MRIYAMANKKQGKQNKIEEKNKQKKSENLENLRQYVLDEIEEKSARKGLNKKDLPAVNTMISKYKKKKDIGSLKFTSLKKEIHKKGKFNFLNWLIRFFAILFVILIIFFGIILSGVYYFKWDNIYINKAIDYLPLPVAKVGDDFIPYKDFRDMSQAQLASLAKMGDPSKLEVVKEDVKTDILERLIDKKITENISKNKNIFLTEEEIKVYYDIYVGESGSEENLEKIVLEMYGWDLIKFKNMVLKPFILQNKLNNYFVWSKEFNTTGEQKASDILSQLKEDSSEEKFIELAKNSSEDAATANSGGNLGWIERGKMVQEFDQAAFSLELGQISEIIRTMYGFHIIMVDEINEEEGKIKVRHIFIKARHLGDAIAEEKTRTKIIKFLK